MTKLTVDSDLRAKLGGFQDLVEFCDENGQVVGFFHPIGATANAPVRKTTSPIPNDEIEAARQQKSGRPLTDIWTDLDRQG